MSFSLEIKATRNPNNYYTLGIIVPLRSKAYKDEINAVKNDPSIKFETEPWPVGITIGYNFGL